jgi:hypothetical protein
MGKERMMTASKEDLDAFAREYEEEKRELLVLFSDANGGGCKAQGDLWAMSAYFLAYVDTLTGKLEQGKGRVAWPLAGADLKEHGSSYPYHFKRGSTYRLRVRGLTDRTVPEGMNPSFYNRFLVVEVLEEDAACEALDAVLEDYRRPVVLDGGSLGSFTLDKDCSCFNGDIDWQGEEVHVSMDVDSDDEGSWARALDCLRTLSEHRDERDGEWRRFAAEKLTELANDWREDEDEEEIAEDAFAARMSPSELSLDADGEYTAYYDDEDMFYGHVITVDGTVEDGMRSASIAG